MSKVIADVDHLSAIATGIRPDDTTSEPRSDQRQTPKIGLVSRSIKNITEIVVPWHQNERTLDSELLRHKRGRGIE